MRPETTENRPRSWKPVLIRMVIYVIITLGLAAYFQRQERKFAGKHSADTASAAPEASAPVILKDAEMSAPQSRKPLVVLLVPEDDDSDWQEAKQQLSAEFGPEYQVVTAKLASLEEAKNYFAVDSLPFVIVYDKDNQEIARQPFAE